MLPVVIAAFVHGAAWCACALAIQVGAWAHLVEVAPIVVGTAYALVREVTTHGLRAEHERRTSKSSAV